MPKVVAVTNSKNDKPDDIYIATVLHHLHIEDTPIVNIEDIPKNARVLYFIRITSPRLFEEIKHDRLSTAKKQAESLCLITMEVIYSPSLQFDFSDFSNMIDVGVSIHMSKPKFKQPTLNHLSWMHGGHSLVKESSGPCYAKWFDNENNRLACKTVHSFLDRPSVDAARSCVIL